MNLPSPLAFAPVVLFFASSVLAQIERPIPYPIPQGAQWKNAVAGGTRTNDGSAWCREAREGAQRHTVDVKHWLSGKKTKTLQFKKDVAKVVIDPDRITLDTSRRNNTWRK
jgi:hypothetical protein